MGDVTIGLLHPGEMGAAVGQCLVGAGHQVLWVPAGRSLATAARAGAAGLTAAGGLAELVRRSGIIVSVCPPHAALGTAREVAGFGGVYVDANAIAPATAREVARIVEAGGASYVDGGIIGTPPVAPGFIRFYLSGARAGEVARLFAGSGVDARVIDDGPGAVGSSAASGTSGSSEASEALGDSGSSGDSRSSGISGSSRVSGVSGSSGVSGVSGVSGSSGVSGVSGSASALKMAYASWTKGSAALLLAARALARAEGVEEVLLAEWAISQPGLAERSARAAGSAAAKGWRWVAEMEEIAATMAGAGLPDGFHLAAAEIYGRSRGAPGPALDEVLAALRRGSVER